LKVLITGGDGQLGRSLSATAPAEVTCLALGRADLNLADDASICRAFARHRPELVINAGAYTAVDLAEQEAELAARINAQGVESLAAACRAGGARLLQISTDFVFDGRSSSAYRPDAPRAPLSVYGRTKAEGEDAAGHGAIIVRTSWVYAAQGKNFVRTMLKLMRDQRSVRVVSDQIGAPTCAVGLAGTVWNLAAKAPAGIYHHRDAGVASWYDFAVAIAEDALAAGLLDHASHVVPVSTAEFPRPAQRPAFSVLDDHRTRELLGDRPAHWRENLRRTLREVREHG
jgi:dTDP-4-dehydrorhamnose reductase